jgi:hypothetical protein
VGAKDGTTVGAEGTYDGHIVGEVGSLEGATEGDVGVRVGKQVGSVGSEVGTIVGKVDRTQPGQRLPSGQNWQFAHRTEFPLNTGQKVKDGAKEGGDVGKT